jgi:hypothetical protein
MKKLRTSLRKSFQHLTGPSTPDKSHENKGKTEPTSSTPKATNSPEPATQPRSPPKRSKSERSGRQATHAPAQKNHTSTRPPDWRRDQDLTTASRISWEDEIRVHRTIDIHIAEATEFLRRHCFAEIDVVAIVMWARRGCEAATRYVSRCHLVSTREDRAKHVEQTCNDVEAAIKSACALVGSNLVIHVCHAVGKAVTKSVETSLPSSTVCSEAERYKLQCISQSRMYSVIYSTEQQVLRGHFGAAPGIDIPE